MATRPPLVLAILDGFGEAPASDSNAITLAHPRVWMDLRQQYPFTLLEASGEQVGLPCGLMGNSEVGHLNIGAGRIVHQDISRIDNAIADGSFFENQALNGAVAHVLRHGSTLHLFGLVSDGGVHSSHLHVSALLDLARRGGLTGDQVVLHAFLDGRDTPPRSALEHVAYAEGEMERYGVGVVATVCGRYWAMDRDHRWDRVQRAYDALTRGVGECRESPASAIQAAYGRAENDEFVLPTIVGERGRHRVRDDDAVVFFNFRADRARQLTDAFLAPTFDGFERATSPKVHYVTMTRYRDDFACPVAFPPEHVDGIFPQVVSESGLTQLRIAETEKYAHVTFFFSGGDERELPGERRILVPSPRVATYDLQPEMSAREVTGRLLGELESDAPPDVTVLNLANADMVGHTGIIDAAVEAVSVLDHCLDEIVRSVVRRGGTVAVTADHGNCEMMRDPRTGKPHTAHTTNPIPLLLASEELRGRTLRSGGRLCDIATTLLPILGLELDPRMTGVNLL